MRMGINSVGIIGYGNFGPFVHELLKRFVPAIRVRIFAPEKKPDGVTFFTLEEVAQSDAVTLAVPIPAFEEVLTQILPHLGKDTILVDVATVKIHTVEVLKRLAAGRPYIATHPMFGPESYEKRAHDVSGFRIVLIDQTLSKEQYESLVTFLKNIGFTVIEMTAEQHDKHVAETLFLMQFLGQALFKAGFDRTDIDTVSFGFLMDAVESVRGDEQLFKDVYRFNPYCKEVLGRLKSAEQTVLNELE